MNGLPRLMVFTDLALASADVWCERTSALSQGALPGSVVFVMRDKVESVRQRLRFGRELAARARAHGQRFGVADRVDVALALDADWVHLGERSMAPHAARELVPQATLSCAWHDPTRAPEPSGEVSVLSPVVAARKGHEALGFEALRRATAGVRGAVFALGGVDATSAARCLAAGARGVAVIGAALVSSEQEALLGALGIDARSRCRS
jgi:thiamine-phosphate pyrophosphorylase